MQDEQAEAKQLIEIVLSALPDAPVVALTSDLLIENVEDARKVLHGVSLLLGELAVPLAPMFPHLSLLADVVHRVSCEKTATGEQTTQPETEEPKSWNSELPFH